ncbi:NAD(P)(+) transhydrogenase (Re/Si-specific) subunit beta [Sphingobium sp. CR2-8]|uniref:NAD(P)(+) transhydrogenase (Re/Si-specific) subunit beta n=1 Tax=Sphingobium sp. CR2-8 TaxID=1306534 RepID=UPI002DBEA2CE|nr:NAD(P)(+) transhydrogenase (Re/Si-specific) subunit beta [Sphingobium sp. CR2-8]MEC3910427.1 NAD(P)(+) transhydrogenase (Re/Si-specific) subunit beta [Sphingobium sp. CR2-8]
MMPLSGVALLGARMDGVDPSPLVAGAYLLSGVLLLAALRWRGQRHGNRIAMAGIALALAAALYSHDVMNLPEIASALVIGGSIGLLLARRCAARMLPWLVVVAHGLLGMAAMATACALWLNPFAFALVGDDGRITPDNRLLLAAGFTIGAMVVVGALLVAVTRRQTGLAWIGSGAGWAAVTLGFALGNSAMVMAGALAGVAGWRLGWRARRIGPAV